MWVVLAGRDARTISPSAASSIEVAASIGGAASTGAVSIASLTSVVFSSKATAAPRGGGSGLGPLASLSVPNAMGRQGGQRVRMGQANGQGVCAGVRAHL